MIKGGGGGGGTVVGGGGVITGTSVALGIVGEGGVEHDANRAASAAHGKMAFRRGVV